MSLVSLGPLSGQDGDVQDKTSGHVQQGRFSMDDTCSQTAPCYILYIGDSGGFDVSCVKTIGNVSPILDSLDRHGHC